MQPQQPDFGSNNNPVSQTPTDYSSYSASTPGVMPTQVGTGNTAVPSAADVSSLDELDTAGTALEQPVVQQALKTRRRFWSVRVLLVLGLAIVLLVAIGILFLRKNHSQSAASGFDTVHLQLGQFSKTGSNSSSSQQTLRVNGNLEIASSLQATPIVQPANGSAGLLYFDKNLNQFAYFNGQAYVPLGGTNNSTVNNVANTVLNNSTTTINGAVNAVTSNGGTTGTIALFSGSQSLGDSIISQNNGTIEVNGNLNLVNNTPSSPMSIWDPSATPIDADFNDHAAVEVGIKFQTDITGRVNGIRFYKGPLNTGSHVGDLWTSSGHLLATVTFTNETASGWQQAFFASPVVITPGNTYVISYHTDVGLYAADLNYFTTKGFDTPPLHALQDGVDGSNGVFVFNATPAFPNQGSINAANYWVDVNFTPNSIPGVIQFAGAQITSSALANNADIAKRSSGQVFTGANTFRNINNSATAFVIQDASANALFTADTASGTITIARLNVTADLTLSRHLTATSLVAPTIAVGSAACTGGTATATGTDVSGLVTITSGTGCSGVGKLATLTFNAVYTVAPHVVLTPANANAAGLAVYVDKATITTAAFDLQAASGTITNTTEYDWYYQVIQ